MKGRCFKISTPSSRRKESKAPTTYPRQFPKGKTMDLSYPIMKLQHRADFERECAAQGVANSDGPISDADQKRLTGLSLDHAAQCEAAIAILKAAQ